MTEPPPEEKAREVILADSSDTGESQLSSTASWEMLSTANSSEDGDSQSEAEMLERAVEWLKTQEQGTTLKKTEGPWRSLSSSAYKAFAAKARARVRAEARGDSFTSEAMHRAFCPHPALCPREPFSPRRGKGCPG